MRRLAKRHEGFFGRTASSVVAGLILAALATTLLWEWLYAFATTTLGVIFAPVALPLAVVAALPLLGAAALRLWQLIQAGVAGLLATEEIGGLVAVGDIAFQVRELRGYSGSRLQADGPFCSRCSVRLTDVPAGYGFRVPTCLTADCPGSGRPPNGISMNAAEHRAEALIEAAFNDAIRRGRRPVVNPTAPFSA